MEKFPKFIENGDVIESFFGYWPTFHDDEIVNTQYDMEQGTFVINIKSQANSDKNAKIDFTFCRVNSITLNDIFLPSIIFGISFTPINNKIKVDIDSSYGLNGELLCEEIIVNLKKL